MDQRVIVFERIVIVGISIKIKDSFVYSEVYLLNFSGKSTCTLLVLATTTVTQSASLAVVIAHIVLIGIKIHTSAPLSEIDSFKRQIKLGKECAAAKSDVGGISLTPFLIR